MKVRTSFLKRCLALALALVLLVSGTNMGVALQAFAADNAAETTVQIGKIVADSYDLTDAEKALLSSGYLVGGTYSYTEPSEELVSVDTDKKTITAKSSNGWVPTEAYIMVGGESKETVALTNGAGTYTYGGNTFAVEVSYTLDINVAEETQKTLLNTAGWLKAGVANVDKLVANDSALSPLTLAMPQLVELAQNGYTVGSMKANVDDATKAAINRLNDQLTANGGKLDLVVMQENYSAGKTSYLLNNGTTMKAKLEETKADVALIRTLLNTINTVAGSFPGMVDESLVNLVGLLHSSLNTWVTAAETVIAGDWTAAEKGTALVSTSVDYAELDKLVAKLGDITTAPTVKNPLHVADVSVQKNLNMFNVTVTVIMNVVEDKADSADLIEYGKTEAVKLTLSAGAAKADIEKAVADAKIETNAQASWADVYDADHYETEVTDLPETLTEDIEYTITYTPKNYDVDLAGEAMSVPYGYQLTLPAHEDSAKAYDYTVNGESMAQGEVYTVVGDTTITRAEGKAYTTKQLLAVIAENYASENEKVTAILKSGALNVDETINVRVPSQTELETLVKLDGSTLTAGDYASSYAGLNWEPYTYVVDGTANKFNGENKVTISGDFEKVVVYYRLTLTNYTKAEVREILALVETLADEAAGQKSVMDRLAGYKDQMSQLNKNMLNGLNGMIGGYAKSEGGKFDDELVSDMQATISAIIKEACESDGSLKLNGIITGYNDANNGGLLYYYKNADTIIAEVDTLSSYLNAMLGSNDSKKLVTALMNELGYGTYVEKLDNLNENLAKIKEDLVPTNESIDTTDAVKLSALVKALEMDGSVEVASYDSPYLEMDGITRTADKYVTVEVKVTAAGKSNTTPITVTVLKGTELTQAQVDKLKADVGTFVTNTLGDDVKYYNNDYSNGADLDALVGEALDANKTYTYQWTAKKYTVKIDGEKDQTVTIENLTVTLPEHTTAGMSYEYTVGGKTVSAGIYTFTADQLDTLFVNGTCTITRTEKNESIEKLVKMVNEMNTYMGFEAMTLVETNGVYTGINTNIAVDDLMNFVQGLVMKSGYGYIGLNNEGLVYSNSSDELEICIQTLINAVLNDSSFNNDTVIALAENGKGKVLTASMQLGNSASDLNYSDLNFTLNLKSVPEQLTANADYIKTASQYLKFNSNKGVLDVEVNLPDQVYAAYAAALVATGNVDKTDVNALSQAVAMQFLYDYLTAITGSEMDLETFTNTLNMLDVDEDLTGYNKYYTKGIDAYNEYVTVAISEDGAAVNVSAPGKTTIEALLKVADITVDANTLGMIKEYDDGEVIVADAKATLGNTDKTYYALIADVQADGVTNKFEAPSDYDALKAETSTLAGYSAVMLLDNVPGALTFSGTTVLDLNGKNVEGTITSTGTLYIIDSSMDTYNAGTVEGVSGNVTIIAGNYKSDVSSFLKDGYYMDGTTVRNNLYYISDANSTVNFVLNADVLDDGIPSVKALAVDIAADLVLNYALSANLTVEGYELIYVAADDLVGLYAGDNRAETAIKTVISWFTVGAEGYENEEGFEGVVNKILADLTDFGAISTALTNGTELASYKVSTQPYAIEIEHITNGNYATVNVGSNADLTKTFNIALTVESEGNKYIEYLATLTSELDKIVEKDKTSVLVDIPQPTYADKKLTVTGAGKAIVSVDMSVNSDYATILGVILAYGNPAKRADVAAAINSNDTDALKTVVDNTKVAELFTALKALSRNVDFAAMAKAVGVKIDVTSAAELEDVYHLVLCGAGKVLEELDITGKDSKLGGLYNDETGYYELTKTNMLRDTEITKRGYTALVELEVDELTLNVKLFAEEEDCMWGDANHDNFVNGDDATLILWYELGVAPEGFCTKRTDVNDDGKINGDDATCVLWRELDPNYVFPAEKN